MIDWGALAGATNQLGFGIYNAIQNRQDVSFNRNREEQWRSEDQAREDNAVQRRVRDLQEAGLSPTLAAGSAASSQAINPNEISHNEVSDMGASQMLAGLKSQRLENELKEQKLAGNDAQSQYLKELEEGARVNRKENEREYGLFSHFGQPKNMQGTIPQTTFTIMNTLRHVEEHPERYPKWVVNAVSAGELSSKLLSFITSPLGSLKEKLEAEPILGGKE